ncbi:IS3 family transposase [Sphingobacterium bambusae]|uniref:IS3 family transposase n=1 Tax=Sphingobacterium bambusae TaxID=662858 RepID=A0ABW6BJI5_9SPHI|nr:IS3 family transposase [Sphingobacterium bambusae]WPL49478.1 IS3 family transposase [Sphingobacterium bambusae]
MLEHEIRKAFKERKNRYGSLRITKALNEKRIKFSKARVDRIMKKIHLQSIVKNKFKVTTDSNHKFTAPENKLDSNFKTGNLGAIWVSDITYIRTKQGWLYLTTVIDMGDQKVIGWASSAIMKAIDTVIPAFSMVQKNRPTTQDLIFYSDKGIKYAYNEFRILLEINPLIIISMREREIAGTMKSQKAFLRQVKQNVYTAITL